MSDIIYRYIEITKFLDMILHNQIVLVKPSLWEDPYEDILFMQYLEQVQTTQKFKDKMKKDGYDLGLILKYVVSNHLYALCWTRLEESDALWRIYSNNNIAIRIGVEELKLKKLDNCILKNVSYMDYDQNTNLLDKDFYDLFTMKRKAFQHEQEVRLISHIKFSGDTQEIQEYLKAIMILGGKTSLLDKEKSIEEEVNEIGKLLNIGNNSSKSKIIDILNISDFIDSVMLHPNAPDWVNKVLETFCKKYDLNYLGKSKLYTI